MNSIFAEEMDELPYQWQMSNYVSYKKEERRRILKSL
jgi:hypothetical protein